MNQSSTTHDPTWPPQVTAVLSGLTGASLLLHHKNKTKQNPKNPFKNLKVCAHCSPLYHFLYRRKIRTSLLSENWISSCLLPLSSLPAGQTLPFVLSKNASKLFSFVSRSFKVRIVSLSPISCWFLVFILSSRPSSEQKAFKHLLVLLLLVCCLALKFRSRRTKALI